MSDIIVRPLRAVARLSCDMCDARWESEPYTPQRWGDETAAAQPAFDAGWKLYNGKRARRVYCPDHEPRTPMLLIYGNVEVGSHRD